MGQEVEHRILLDTYEVTDFAPNRQVAFEADATPWRSRIFYEVQPVDGGRTRITMGEEMVRMPLVWIALWYALSPLLWPWWRWTGSRRLRRIGQRLESA